VEDHIGSPTYAPLLASRTIDLMEQDHHGVFHIGGGTPISWFNFARLIFEAAGLHPALHATSEREYRTPARRPKYSALSNEKMERAGLAAMPPLAECLKAYLAAREELVPQANV
jgi:dTDP-4-dehydrorhamnose reductase